MEFLSFLACVVVLGVKTAEAVKCLQCVDMPHPFDCNVVTECTSQEHCYVEQFITSSGITLYNSGCLSKQRCAASKRDIQSYVVKRQDELLSKQDLVTCIECCQGEFCNIQGCYDNAVARPNRGPKCFDCHAQNAPEQCRDTLNCDYDQVCALLHDHPYDKEWTSKCMGRVQCQALVRFQQAHLIGKRATVNVKNCPRCCEDDFCNDSCGHNVTSIATTAVPTQAPTTHPPIKTTAKKTTHAPTTHKPATHKASTTHKPKTTTHKPTTHKPATHKPATTTHKPTTTTRKPTTHKPATHKPTTHMPATHKATTTQKPTTHKPTTATHKPRTHKPTTTTHKPTTHKPTTHKPATHKATTTQKPTTHKPTTATHKPRTHKPTTTTHKPTTHKPTTHKPTTHVPTTTAHIITTTDPRIACEADGYVFDPPTRMCLKFVMDKKNWTDAQTVCKRDHGMLVVMTSPAKINDVEHYLATKSKYHGINFWVGATEISHVHTFTWTNGKTIVVDDYAKYDLTNTNCLLTANPKPAVTYDFCRTKKSFICENSNYIRA